MDGKEDEMNFRGYFVSLDLNVDSATSHVYRNGFLWYWRFEFIRKKDVLKTDKTLWAKPNVY